MELIKTYDGKITDRKPVNFDDLESLDNSDVILLTEDESRRLHGRTRDILESAEAWN